MSITHAADGYTVLPDDETLAATLVALEEHGFSIEVVSDLDAAREAVVARTLNAFERDWTRLPNSATGASPATASPP